MSETASSETTFEIQPIPLHTQTRHGSNIGQPMTRREGVLKATGRARYAADHHPAGMLYAVIATAGIASGRVTSLDVAAAKQHPGVVEVMTSENRPPLAIDPDAKFHPFMFRMELLQNSDVRYANQAIAVVIAESLEAATEGAYLLRPTYEESPARIGLDAPDAFQPAAVGVGGPALVEIGDVEAGFSSADRIVEATYETPAQFHNAMEPHAVVASWDGDKLTIDTPSQGMAMAIGRLSGLLGVSPENILIRSPYLGGGFGSKGMIAGPQVLGVLAAKLVGKPVKLVLKRDQMYGPVGHRSASRQTVRLGLDAEGGLTAIDHAAKIWSSTFDDFFEPAADVPHTLYASPAIRTSYDAVRVNMGTPLFMRAPGEATGSIALESAIDEAAFAAGMDPLAFRLKNYAEVEPASGKPFSSKALRECYALGAERFGWRQRPLMPGQMRDRHGYRVGWGVGTATFPAIMFEGNARAILKDDGTGIVESGSQDMGQGAWTAFAQIAADALALDLARIEYRAGTSDLPDAGIAGGSGHTATVGVAIGEAGRAVIAKLADLAFADPRSPLYGAGNVGVVARNGRLSRRDDETRGEPYGDILKRAGLASIEASGKGARAQAEAETYAMHAHGAVFAEVTVDPDLGQVRATRLLGVFAAGRIINPRMVKSQLLGGMIWGVSFALNEEAIIDHRTGRILNADLGEYHVPVNADVPLIEALTVDEIDPHVNSLGIKGVGEIGITGSAGAVANAIWHATGVRIRRFPAKIEDILAGLN